MKQKIIQVQVRYEALLECGHLVSMTKSRYERYLKRATRRMGCYKCTENGTQRKEAPVEEQYAGKETREAFYFLLSEIDHVDPHRKTILEKYAKAKTQHRVYNSPGGVVVKVSAMDDNVSFLYYPGFQVQAHPPLMKSVVVNAATGEKRTISYATRKSKPILHRKELLVGPDHPRRATYAKLTRMEERAGLLGGNGRIGTERTWEFLLKAKGFHIVGHDLKEDGSVEP